MKRFSGLMIIFSMLAAMPCFADCDSDTLDGNWTRSESEYGLVDTGTTWIWSFHESELTVTTQLTDNLTASGTYGPYYEKQTLWSASLLVDCTLQRTALESTTRSYRVYDEPTESREETRAVEERRSEWFGAELSKDRKQLTLTGADRKTVVLKRVP